MGVKTIAKQLLYCPIYIPHETAFSSMSSSRHEQLKKRVKEFFEEKKYKMKCVEEEPIVLPNGSKGKIDLLCRGEGFDVIIEVKSNYTSTMSLSDLLQLFLYIHAYIQRMQKEGMRKKVHAYLAYRGLNDEPLLIEIADKLYRDMMDIVSNATKVDAVSSTTYVAVGHHCNYCGVDDCPFNQRRGEVQTGE